MEKQIDRYVDAPLKKVWSYIIDEDKVKTWTPQFVGVEFPDGLAAQRVVGTKFRQKLKEGGKVSQYDGEMLAFEPEKMFGVRVYYKTYTVDVFYRLSEAASPNKTKLSFYCKLSFNNQAANLVSSLFNGVFADQLQGQIKSLKAAIERGA